MRLIAVGRMGSGPEAALYARYAGRLKQRLVLRELAEARGSGREIRRREADGILAALKPDTVTVALDATGEALDSVAFSARMSGWLEGHRPVNFIIGGAEGLDERVMARADTVLSLGNMTWPHLLARVMLAEQLYRAISIAARHPYHRGSRP